MVKYSIIMRSHNDIDFINQTIEGLQRQSEKDFELICCDDRSNDGTSQVVNNLSFAKKLPPLEGRYVPGRVLNRAIKACNGEIIIFNNADAIIKNVDWLKNLTSPFSDPAVGATYGNQVARASAWEVVKKDYNRAFGDGKIAAQWGLFFSLASSAAPKKLLLEHPFDENIQYSEDLEWARRVSTLGYKIVYTPNAITEHSHNYPPTALWRRFYNEGVADITMGKDSISFMVFMRQYLAETMRDFIEFAPHFKIPAILFSPIYRFIQKFAYYRGTK